MTNKPTYKLTDTPTTALEQAFIDAVEHILFSNEHTAEIYGYDGDYARTVLIMGNESDTDHPQLIIEPWPEIPPMPAFDSPGKPASEVRQEKEHEIEQHMEDTLGNPVMLEWQDGSVSTLYEP